MEKLIILISYNLLSIYEYYWILLMKQVIAKFSVLF